MSVEGVGAAEWRRLDRTLLSIQYLRAGAAIFVLFAHGYPDPPQIVMTVLARAVDLFFLMSGFIVVMITTENTRPLEFFRDRLERIVPLYWLLTLACFFLLYSGILAPMLDPSALVSKLARADWQFLAQSLLFIPAYSPLSPYVHPVVAQGWTLNFEMMFYATFALALFLPRRLVVPALTLLYAILIVIGVVWAQGPAARTWTSPLIFEFILGLWTGVAWRKGWDFRFLYLCFMAASVPLIGVAVAHEDWPTLLGGLPLLPLVLAIFLLVLSRDRRGAGLPEWRPARLLGDASYSIYLWHFIPILLLNRVSQSFPLSPTVTMIGVVLGGLVGGFAVYYLVERPIMRAVRAMRRARRLQRGARSEASREPPLPTQS